MTRSQVSPPALAADCSWIVGPHLVNHLKGQLRLYPHQAPSDPTVVQVVKQRSTGSESDRALRNLHPRDLLDEAGLRGRPIVVSGHQPSYHAYIPLLCKAAATDVFTFADDMAFGRQKFQHRQRVPVDGVDRWMTLPVLRSKGRCSIGSKCLDPEPAWRHAHWELLQRAFGTLPYFDLVGDFYEQVYKATWRTVAEIDHALWIPLALQLCPSTLSWNSSTIPFDRDGRKGDRIAAELEAVAPFGGTYLAGGASDYLNDPSDEHPGLTYRQVIELAGFEILRPYIDVEVFGECTPTTASATSVELIAREGRAAPEILRCSTRFDPMPSP